MLLSKIVTACSVQLWKSRERLPQAPCCAANWCTRLFVEMAFRTQVLDRHGEQLHTCLGPWMADNHGQIPQPQSMLTSRSGAALKILWSCSCFAGQGYNCAATAGRLG